LKVLNRVVKFMKGINISIHEWVYVKWRKLRN